ncbi:MAG: 2-oxo acid dehydrogenase subunit E2 [Pseudomonadota bacterium]
MITQNSGAETLRGRIFASPLAKRIAKDAGIDLVGIQGSGPHGRIIKVDVEKVLQSGRPASTIDQASPEPPEPPPTHSPAVLSGGSFKEVRVSSVRKIIARRLTESKQTIPHFYLTIDCELDALLSLRRDINERERATIKISVNDFVIRAVAKAIALKPEVNASWGGDKILQYDDIDVSVAVSIDDGLITPIVRRADQKSVAAISTEMKDLASRARDNRLKPEEFQGGGFSISNLGMFGVREFAAVINPPQACILAVGAGEQRAIVKDGVLAVGTLMTCILSVDHRVVDGALGAEFLAGFKKQIEDPIGLLL